MEEKLLQMFEIAKKEKRTFRLLKRLVVSCQLFEFAAHLRGIENQFFPETNEAKTAKSRAKELNLLFRMAELNVPEQTCHLIDALIKGFDKKKNKFSINDAVTISHLNKEYFDVEE